MRLKPTHCTCDDSGVSTARAALVEMQLGAVEGRCSAPENEDEKENENENENDGFEGYMYSTS
jgi:hypothetical protein